MQKTIAVIVDNYFDDVEYSKPVDAFKNAGHSLINVGLKKGKILVGKKRGTKVHIDKSVKDVSVDDFDALFIPGGYSPDKLRIDEDAVRFVKDFVESGKPVFSICHGPQLLITAQVLKGRKITGWKSIVQDIKNSGAVFIDKDVVIDGNLISSRSPDDLPNFIKITLESLKKL